MSSTVSSILWMNIAQQFWSFYKEDKSDLKKNQHHFLSIWFLDLSYFLWKVLIKRSVRCFTPTFSSCNLFNIWNEYTLLCCLLHVRRCLGSWSSYQFLQETLTVCIICSFIRFKGGGGDEVGSRFWPRWQQY